MTKKVFGPPHAVISLTRLGYRYFRILIKASPESQERLIMTFSKHPNVGWIFRARGYFTIGVGFWAKDNAEINDISQKVRSMLESNDTIVQQSELTYLVSFGNRPSRGAGGPYTLVDSVQNSTALTPIEDDYIKLIAMDSSLSTSEYARILNTPESNLMRIEAKLKSDGVVLGIQERMHYSGIYCKVFLDSLSATSPNALESLTDLLWVDTRCVYFGKANSKYDIEFEIVVGKMSDLGKVLKKFSDTKVAIITENCYTNLYPGSKVANVKEIRDALVDATGTRIDLGNSKLWYLNHSGAEAYLNIYKGNKEYFESMEDGEIRLFPVLAEYLHTRFTSNTHYSVIDIGSGDGVKGKFFIKALGEDSVKAYYPLDIQHIELSAALGVHESGKYAKHPTFLSIENIDARFPLSVRKGERCVYVFFGGTYGNFKPEVLHPHLAKLLHGSETLLVTMPIVDNGVTDEEIIATYTGAQFDQVVVGPLLQVGFERSDFKPNPTYPHMVAHFEMNERRLISKLVLAKDVVKVDRQFKAGTEFLITSSWKPTLKEFHAALSKDFEAKKIFSNNTTAVAVIEANIGV